MMAQMQATATTMGHHTTAPDKGGKTDSPCKQGVVCQMGANAPVLAETSVAVFLTANAADLCATYKEGGPSRPPDRDLRPPKQL